MGSSSALATGDGGNELDFIVVVEPCCGVVGFGDKLQIDRRGKGRCDAKALNGQAQRGVWGELKGELIDQNLHGKKSRVHADVQAHLLGQAGVLGLDPF